MTIQYTEKKFVLEHNVCDTPMIHVSGVARGARSLSDALQECYTSVNKALSLIYDAVTI